LVQEAYVVEENSIFEFLPALPHASIAVRSKKIGDQGQTD
jgi:hypothetical protein